MPALLGRSASSHAVPARAAPPASGHPAHLRLTARSDLTRSPSWFALACAHVVSAQNFPVSSGTSPHCVWSCAFTCGHVYIMRALRNGYIVRAMRRKVALCKMTAGASCFIKVRCSVQRLDQLSLPYCAPSLACSLRNVHEVARGLLAATSVTFSPRASG